MTDKGDFLTRIPNKWGSASVEHMMVPAETLAVSEAGACWTDENDETLVLIQAVGENEDAIASIAINRVALVQLITALQEWMAANDDNNGHGMNH